MKMIRVWKFANIHAKQNTALAAKPSILFLSSGVTERSMTGIKPRTFLLLVLKAVINSFSVLNLKDKNSLTLQNVEKKDLIT